MCKIVRINSTKIRLSNFVPKCFAGNIMEICYKNIDLPFSANCRSTVSKVAFPNEAGRTGRIHAPRFTEISYPLASKF